MIYSGGMCYHGEDFRIHDPVFRRRGWNDSPMDQRCYTSIFVIAAVVAAAASAYSIYNMATAPSAADVQNQLKKNSYEQTKKERKTFVKARDEIIVKIRNASLPAKIKNTDGTPSVTGTQLLADLQKQLDDINRIIKQYDDYLAAPSISAAAAAATATPTTGLIGNTVADTTPSSPGSVTVVPVPAASTPAAGMSPQMIVGLALVAVLGGAILVSRAKKGKR